MRLGGALGAIFAVIASLLFWSAALAAGAPPLSFLEGAPASAPESVCASLPSASACHAALRRAADAQRGALLSATRCSPADGSGSRARLVVVTGVHGLSATAVASLEANRGAYARRHEGVRYCLVDWRAATPSGVALADGDKAPLGRESAAWSKLIIVRALLPLAERVLWLDADALVTRPEVDVVRLVEADEALRAKDVVIGVGHLGRYARQDGQAQDEACFGMPPAGLVFHRGWLRQLFAGEGGWWWRTKSHSELSINTGAFLVRSGRWARHWLLGLYLYPWGLPRDRYVSRVYEQEAMWAWMKERPDEADQKVGFVSAATLQAPPGVWRPAAAGGGLAIHPAGFDVLDEARGAELKYERLIALDEQCGGGGADGSAGVPWSSSSCVNATIAWGDELQRHVAGGMAVINAKRAQRQGRAEEGATDAPAVRTVVCEGAARCAADDGPQCRPISGWNAAVVKPAS